MPNFPQKIHPLTRIGLFALLIMSAVYAYHNYKVSEEERAIDTFHAVHIAGLMNVYLQAGDAEQITIKADDRILPKIKTVVDNGVLQVYTEGLIRGERIKEAYITYVQLDSLHAAGVGTLTSRGILALDTFKLQASAAAEVRLQLQAQQLELSMFDNANVQLAGTVNEFLCSIHHHGDIMAYNLKANKARVHMETGPQSPGIARIHVIDSLWAEVSGPRHLYYQGEPNFVYEIVKGSGKVSRK